MFEKRRENATQSYGQLKSNIAEIRKEQNVLFFVFFFIQDIYYYNYKELLNKKIITKF